MRTTDTLEFLHAATDRPTIMAVPALVRPIRFAEGSCAQILHVGPADDEAGSVRLLVDAVVRAGMRPRGHLHEIHLADIRLVPRERRRSILRLPVEEA